VEAEDIDFTELIEIEEKIAAKDSRHRIAQVLARRSALNTCHSGWIPSM
jgi:hypothetical protein